MLVLTLVLATQRLMLPPAPLATDLEKWVVPDMQLPVEQVRPGQNGWSLAMHAVAVNKNGPWVTQDLLQAWDRRPDSKCVQQSAQIVDSWQHGIALLKAAVQGPYWIPPNSDLAVALSFPQYVKLKGFVKVLLLKVKLDLYQGRPKQAVEDLSLAELAGERTASGEGPLIREFVGQAMISLTDATIRRLCSAGEFGPKDLQNLLRVVPVHRSLGKLANALRHEFQSELRFWASTFGPGGPVSKSTEPTDLDRVLGDHPDPLDWKQTAWSGSELYGLEVQNCRRSWRNRVNVKARCEALAKLLPSVFSELLAPSNSSHLVSLNEDQLEQLKADLLKISNPVGIWLVSLSGSSIGGAEEAERRGLADIRATAIVVANRLYRRRNGRDIHDLRELTRAGIIASVPVDPFTDGPLRFDPATSKVISAGPGPKALITSEPQKFQWRIDGRS